MIFLSEKHRIVTSIGVSDDAKLVIILDRQRLTENIAVMPKNTNDVYHAIDLGVADKKSVNRIMESLKLIKGMVDD